MNVSTPLRSKQVHASGVKPKPVNCCVFWLGFQLMWKFPSEPRPTVYIRLLYSHMYIFDGHVTPLRYDMSYVMTYAYDMSSCMTCYMTSCMTYHMWHIMSYDQLICDDHVTYDMSYMMSYNMSYMMTYHMHMS